VRIVLVAAEVECSECREAKAILGRVTERFPELEVQSLKTTDAEAAAYGVVMSPTVIVDNTIVASGRAPNERKLTAFIEASG
jgi:predicted DsbA family dithiol-disulfide isomerase